MKSLAKEIMEHHGKIVTKKRFKINEFDRKTDLPTFGGSQKENVRIFFETFEKLSAFYKWDDERNLQALH